MSMNEKSETSKLYYCDDLRCRVVTFKPDGHHPLCPGCQADGILIREATSTRLGMARK